LGLQHEMITQKKFRHFTSYKYQTIDARKTSMPKSATQSNIQNFPSATEDTTTRKNALSRWKIVNFKGLFAFVSININMSKKHTSANRLNRLHD
jgi:hypothetical protein